MAKPSTDMAPSQTGVIPSNTDTGIRSGGVQPDSCSMAPSLMSRYTPPVRRRLGLRCRYTIPADSAALMGPDGKSRAAGLRGTASVPLRSVIMPGLTMISVVGVSSQSVPVIALYVTDPTSI